MAVFLRTRAYRCCICHCVIERFDAIRLVKQKYNTDRFANTGNNYDFCKKCYKVFAAWLKKHKEEQ